MVPFTGGFRYIPPLLLVGSSGEPLYRPLNPLKAGEARKASGTVHVGGSGDAPNIDLASEMRKETLEASSGNEVKFPVTLTLLLPLPGMGPDAKLELFNFAFTKFLDERGPGSCHPMADMTSMRR
jgi:hypothetical protein